VISRYSFLLVSILLTGALLLSGCKSSDSTPGPTSCDPNLPGPSLAEDLRLTLPPPDPADSDAQWADIARQAPGGWGGVFLGSNNTLTIYLVDPTKETEAKTVLFSVGVGLPRDIRTAQVRKGRWDFAQLFDWYRYIQPHINFSNGVSFTDIDEAANRLHYGMVSSEAMASLEATFQSLNLPCELVIVDVVGPITVAGSKDAN
jgi:hypothetical protein